jgi:hypothetical protein
MGARPALAGIGDEELVLALVAVGAGEAIRKDAAFVIAAEGSLDMDRWCFTVLAAGEAESMLSTAHRQNAQETC